MVPGGDPEVDRPLAEGLVSGRAGQYTSGQIWTRSSAGEHHVDIVGVAGSIPAASTTAPTHRIRRAKGGDWITRPVVNDPSPHPTPWDNRLA